MNKDTPIEQKISEIKTAYRAILGIESNTYLLETITPPLKSENGECLVTLLGQQDKKDVKAHFWLDSAEQQQIYKLLSEIINNRVIKANGILKSFGIQAPLNTQKGDEP